MIRLLLPIFPTISTNLRRSLLSTAAKTKPPAKDPNRQLKNLCYRHRARALIDARRALVEYLHSTRAIPFSHAELIASHSPLSLYSLLSQVRFPPSPSPSVFPRALRSFLSFRPPNEFDFFFESIGLSPPPPESHHSHSLFLSDDPHLLPAVSALVRFGFPWTKLGLLYQEEPTIFLRAPDDLLARLHHFESFGISRISVIAVCLVFPSVLVADRYTDSEVDHLFEDLKSVFVGFELHESLEENVDVLLDICRRIRVFYELGSKNEAMGELISRNRRVFLEFDNEFLAQKLNFFLRMGMSKEEVGPFILQRPEIFDFDFEIPSIAMPSYLIQVGMGEEDAKSLSRKYPYVMGRNKLGSLPGLMRAMNLHEWFLSKIKNGNHHYLSQDFASYSSFNVKMEKDFLEDLERVKSSKKHEYLANKLDFLLGIGFGQNKITSRALGAMHGTRDNLQERFDYLLELGIEYTMLCRMISATPKLLNQSPETIHEKVFYLCNVLGYCLEYLDNFPAYLCFDLENRIKPRYRIIDWLKENGLLKKHFSPATVLANSEKKFISNLYSIHPAAPKLWLERFSPRNQSDPY